jgi:hypothetical protein
MTGYIPNHDSPKYQEEYISGKPYRRKQIDRNDGIREVGANDNYDDN